MLRDLAVVAVAALAMLGVGIVREHPSPLASWNDALQTSWKIGESKRPADVQPEAFRLPRRWRKRIENHLEAGGQVELESCGYDMVIHLRSGGSI